MTAAPALLPSLHALVKEWRFEAQDYTDRYAQACRQHAEKLEALLSRAATTQLVDPDSGRHGPNESRHDVLKAMGGRLDQKYPLYELWRFERLAKDGI